MIDQEKETNSQHEEQPEERDIFLVEEIKIEELAIDGICGVY